jgi:hypothetical protein
MLGKIVEIYSEFVNISLSDKISKIRIGSWVEFPTNSVYGVIFCIEKNFCQVKVSVGIEGLKIGNDACLDSTINAVDIDLFGNIWGGSNSNLNLLGINFGTKNLELTGHSKYDFIPVVRNGETVVKKQKLGYFELSKDVKYWMLTPCDESEYEVKKINSGSFSGHDKIVTLEKEDKKYELGLSQQFYYEGKILPGSISENVSGSKDYIEKYDFIVSVSEFLDESIDNANLKFVTFLLSRSDNWENILQKGYNVSLFLAYCGYKVLFINNLEFPITDEIKLDFGKTINFEGEEGSVEVLNVQLFNKIIHQD